MKNIFLLGVCSALAVGCSKKNQSPDPLEFTPGKFPAVEEVLSHKQLRLKETENWFTKSPELDGVEGVQADRAINELQLKHEKQILVAVIDSGIDVEHEDLKDKMWVNEKEIPGNKIDDDNNGYIDDIYGWNYLGGYDEAGNPIHIGPEQLEVTRELVKMKAKKKALEAQGKSLNEKDQKYLDIVQTEVGESVKLATETLKLILERLTILEKAFEILKSDLNIKFEEVTEAKVKALILDTKTKEKAKQDMLAVFALSSAKDVARYLLLQGRYKEELDYYYNEEFNPREKIVGDNPEDFSDIGYGNNDVRGPDAGHGTHVSGIIAAVRTNNLGIQGIAENVKIMALRAVPNGDERDKDVAFAVRYAADNGAHIINMSFGKGYSPHKHLVSEAFLYAQSKGVLILHAAGNESTDRDLESRFPEKKVFNAEGEVIGTIDNFMDIGASASTLSRELVATFTNFGQKTVDIFAPGVKVFSTIPDNMYASFNGTSMACPSAAGVAALVWSQRPELTGADIKVLMMKSARLRHGLSVRLPSDHTKDVLFESLSITGGIADAFQMLSN